jgi:hypothetical protein
MFLMIRGHRSMSLALDLIDGMYISFRARILEKSGDWREFPRC